MTDMKLENRNANRSASENDKQHKKSFAIETEAFNSPDHTPEHHARAVVGPARLVLPIGVAQRRRPRVKPRRRFLFNYCRHLIIRLFMC